MINFISKFIDEFNYIFLILILGGMLLLLSVFVNQNYFQLFGFTMFGLMLIVSIHFMFIVSNTSRKV